MWENNTESTLIMKKISLLEKDINLRKRLIEKAEDLEVLNEFLDQEQVKEEMLLMELLLLLELEFLQEYSFMKQWALILELMKT